MKLLDTWAFMYLVVFAAGWAVGLDFYCLIQQKHLKIL
jgi:hypothetical protein